MVSQYHSVSQYRTSRRPIARCGVSVPKKLMVSAQANSTIRYISTGHRAGARREIASSTRHGVSTYDTLCQYCLLYTSDAADDM
eukprot:3607937-Rhodomonas_salina.3